MRKSLTISAFYRTDQSRPSADVSRMGESDWREFASLRLKALADTLGADDPQHRQESSFTAAQWRRRLRVHAQFGAYLDDRAVGLIGAQRESTESVYLYSLWLEPSARGMGLGRALVSAAVEWARAEQARTVTLRVNTANSGARGIYRRLGFRIVPSGAVHEPDEVMMILTLD